jgi:hypothetical protein
MPCPTCDHTLQHVNNGEPRVFWCPRCGTLKTEHGVPEYEVPKLIQRIDVFLCRLETKRLPGRPICEATRLLDESAILGVRECISKKAL